VGKAQNQIDAVIGEFQKALDEEGKRFLYQNGSLYMYHEGYWRMLSMDERNAFNPYLMRACSEIGFDYATKLAPLWTQVLTVSTPDKPVQFDTETIVACRNGSLHMRKDKFMNWSPSHYTTRRLVIDFDEEATCPEWEALLRRSLESPQRTPKQVETMVRFLKQWMGINMVGPAAKAKNRHLRQGLIIDGPSGSGKSTFANVMRELFGEQGCVSPSMDDLGTQFGKASLLNAQALITDDGIGTGTKGDAKVLKAIITGESMMVDRKFQTAVEFEFDGAVLFTTNTLPSISDESDAIYNRLLVVRMDRVFTAEDAVEHFGKHAEAIPFLRDKKEFPGILNWALEGFDEAWSQSKLSIPKEMRSAASAFRMRNDPIYGFMHDALEADEKMLVPSNVMTALFTEYALENYHVKIAAKKAVNSLVRNIKDVIPSVQLELPSGGGQVISYLGLKLSDVGMTYWTRAVAKQLPSVSGVRQPHSRRA
jgi:putative DNA primase/helicase